MACVGADRPERSAMQRGRAAGVRVLGCATLLCVLRRSCKTRESHVSQRGAPPRNTVLWSKASSLRFLQIIDWRWKQRISYCCL